MINETDIRLCSIQLTFTDGSTLTTEESIDMERCIITQVRDKFQIKQLLIKRGSVKCQGVNFKWKELAT